MPVLGNLFGTPRQVAPGHGRRREVSALRDIEQAAVLPERSRQAAQGWKDLWDKWPVFKSVLNMAPKAIRHATVRKKCWKASRLIWCPCRCSTAGGRVAPADHLGLDRHRGPHKSARTCGFIASG